MKKKKLIVLLTMLAALAQTSFATEFTPKGAEIKCDRLKHKVLNEVPGSSAPAKSRGAGNRAS